MASACVLIEYVLIINTHCWYLHTATIIYSIEYIIIHFGAVSITSWSIGNLLTN